MTSPKARAASQRDASAASEAAAVKVSDPKATPSGPGLQSLDQATLAELLRRVREIDGSYRAAAERMGQLYMFADGNRVVDLTRRLDQPMRNAAQNERLFTALLDELKMLTEGPSRRR